MCIWIGVWEKCKGQYANEPITLNMRLQLVWDQLEVKLGTFHVGSIPKFCPKSDTKIDLIRICNLSNLKIYYLNSNYIIGHNSLYTSPNDLKFIFLESLDVGLQFWLRPPNPKMTISKSKGLQKFGYKTCQNWKWPKNDLSSQ